MFYNLYQLYNMAELLDLLVKQLGSGSVGIQLIS